MDDAPKVVALPVKNKERKRVPDEYDVVVNGVIVGRSDDAETRRVIRLENERKDDASKS